MKTHENSIIQTTALTQTTRTYRKKKNLQKHKPQKLEPRS